MRRRPRLRAVCFAVSQKLTVQPARLLYFFRMRADMLLTPPNR
jgi:hypothetical protein